MTGSETRSGQKVIWGRPHWRVEAVDLNHTYTTGTHEVPALRDINLEVPPGRLVAVQGRSGSGKTTLLNMLGGLDRPESGSVMIDGDEITGMGDDDLVDIRRHKVGYIFQAFGLIPILTALENVQVPLRLAMTDVAEREVRSLRLLEMVGLGDRVGHRPHELSGGEQQRVAIARALANRPAVLLADEPTGQLDSRTGRAIVDLLYEVVRNEDVTVIMATHDPAPSSLADQLITLQDGRIAG